MLNVGVLCSGRAPGLDVLTPACIISTHPHTLDVHAPVITRTMFQPRRDYDAGTVEILRAFGVELVILLGYRYILTDVMLAAFPGRILNIHDSDLRERRYVGLHSTRDAILAGETETRSTLHVVTEDVDGGPIISVSRAYPVAPFVHEAAAAGHLDIVKAYAYAQREWMMRDCWAELLAEALSSVEVAA